MPPSGPGVNKTFAPRNLINFLRSIETLSGIVTTKGYPLAAHTIAKPIPVFPLVASTTVWPGFSDPSVSALSIMLFANLSLTELAGLKYSAFTYKFISFGARLFIFITGVLPIVFNIFL